MSTNDTSHGLPPLIPYDRIAEASAEAADGGSVIVTLTRPHERYAVKIPRGAAEVLLAELQGVLANGR